MIAIITREIERYDYDGDEEYDEFKARIQMELNKSGWYLKYDQELRYFLIRCLALNLEWIQAFTEDEYYSFHLRRFPIKEELDVLKWRLFENQQYKNHDEKISIMHSMGEEIDIQSTKKEFDFLYKNRHKIISLLASYEVLEVYV
jgi:hypothetical protein